MIRSLSIPLIVAFLIGGSTAVLAQGNPLVPDGEGRDQAGLMRQVIRDGCSPTAINEAMRGAAFDSLADWLEREGKSQDARRIRAVSEIERREFAKTEPAVLDLLTTGLGQAGQGGKWDPARNLATASVLLGGTDGLVRYVAASRAAQLEVYRTPANYLYGTRGIDLGQWVQQGGAGPGLTALPDDMRYTAVRGAFQIPYNVNRYILQGVGYSDPFTPRETVSVSVNTGALRALEQARADQAERIRQNAQVPLRQTLASKIAERPDTASQPTDEGDTALTYAAWLPNLCIGYQHMLARPIFHRRRSTERTSER